MVIEVDYSSFERICINECLTMKVDKSLPSEWIKQIPQHADDLQGRLDLEDPQEAFRALTLMYEGSTVAFSCRRSTRSLKHNALEAQLSKDMFAWDG